MKKLTSDLRRILAATLGLLFCLLAHHAGAQTLYWDPSPSCGCTTGGGAGTWNAGNAYWYNNSSDTTWVSGDTAYIYSASTITLGDAETAGGLTFNTAGSTIGGSGTLTLNGTAPTITIPTGNTFITNVIAGSSGMTVSGSGTLTLLGVNTYSGGTTNGSGSTLTISGSGKLGNGTYAGAIVNGGTFNWSSTASQTLSGVMSGAAGALVQGGGTLTLSGTNTYTGTTTINSSKTLTISATGKMGNGVYSANITNNGAFSFNGTNSQTLNGVISGTGSLTVNPGALGNLLYLNGANTYSGATTIAGAGQIIITSDSSLGAPPATFKASQLIFEYGFLKANGTFTLNTNRGITMLAGQSGVGASIQVNPGDTLTLAAPIAGTALGVLFGSGEPTYGFGTNLLAATNTYTGPTGISTGRLLLGVNGALPYGTTMIIAPDDGYAPAGAIFDLGGYSQTIGPLASTNTFYAPAGTGSGNPIIVITSPGTLTILQTNTATIFNGIITGSGNLTISGNSNGKLTLQGGPNTYTGLTTINGGTLDGNIYGTIPGNVTVNSGTLELDAYNAMSSTATLTLDATAAVYLNFPVGTPQTISALTTNGQSAAQGLWGALGNLSANYTDSRFTGGGLLLVCPTPDQTITSPTEVCAGATVTASVTVTPGATYSWNVYNGTIVSGGTSSTVTYIADQSSLVALYCTVTAPCGVASLGNQGFNVTVNPCLQSTNVTYSATNGVTLTGTGVPDSTWYLNASTNVTTPLPWPNIQSGTVTFSPFTVNDPDATNYLQRFYYLTNSP